MLLRIITGLSEVKVLADEQHVQLTFGVIVPNTSSLLCPKGADYSFGKATKITKVSKCDGHKVAIRAPHPSLRYSRGEENSSAV